MSVSTQTIFNAIEYAAVLYKLEKHTAATHAFLSPYNYAQLKKELKSSFFSWARAEQVDGSMVLSTRSGSIEIMKVQEDSNDFILVGREDDYLNSVVEKTIL